MGLDNFWECEKHPNFDPPLNLCGGLFSGHGEQSFRGKVYASIIEGVTDYSLYSVKLTQKEIASIAQRLEKTPFKKIKRFNDWDISEEEYSDLIRMFKEYSKVEEVSLTSWY